MPSEYLITQRVILRIRASRLLRKFLSLMNLLFFFSLSFCLLVCSPPSNSDKVSALFKVWHENWSPREGKTFIQLMHTSLKVRPFPSLPCKACIVLFSANNTLLLFFHPFIAFPLSCPDTVLNQALMPKGRVIIVKDSCPKILAAPLLTVWPG